MRETNNDVEEAKIWLKKKGFKDAENKMSRNSGKQVFGIKINNEYSGVGISEVTCETDFVANTEIFSELASSVLNTTLNKKSTINIEDMDKTNLDTKGEQSLLFNQTISDSIKTTIAKTGENCKVNKLQYIELSNNNICGIYLHGCEAGITNYGNSAALTILKSDKSRNNLSKEALNDLTLLASNISMQIVAMVPKFINSESIPSDILNKEKEIIAEKLLNSQEKGKEKPEHVIENMKKSALKKYYDESCLVEQDFVISNNPQFTPGLKVKDLLNIYKKNLGLNELSIERFELVKPGV